MENSAIGLSPKILKIIPSTVQHGISTVGENERVTWRHLYIGKDKIIVDQVMLKLCYCVGATQCEVGNIIMYNTSTSMRNRC